MTVISNGYGRDSMTPAWVWSVAPEPRTEDRLIGFGGLVLNAIQRRRSASMRWLNGGKALPTGAPSGDDRGAGCGGKRR